ncbi:rhodanese-related sulfurtransferase [Vreelandella nigrificans]|uniref:Sulfurtransferase n=1 Tax=Vreelandella nigrificans TaxID=2042704 RepID=A0A2A4HMV9_9GAMM|nr:rhodanese-related sulfurtransferase [Halomonas nigrificans]PCF95535.1 sulfurtransferase [Halomonas nigrificans]
MSNFRTLSGTSVIRYLKDKQEIAIIDVREEAPFAEGHPLFATNIPLSRLELEIFTRVPRLNTPVVVYDNGEALAEPAYQKLSGWGYSDVALLEGGLKGWEAAGGEIFHDVNSPSKAFGELVESVRHTPSLAAEEVKALLDARADVVVLDARRFDEYQTMSIPTGISVPGAELALRVKELAPAPSTQVIVNCAGRTRSLIGTQSLINAGIQNPVAALRNGTIGWTLAGQTLEHGQSRSFQPVSDETRLTAATSAHAVADRAGVKRATRDQLFTWQQDATRTTYLFDVRTPDEFTAGHFPGAFSAPGGQLVQETDHHAAVRGARVVLVDDDGVRANMTASWLAQMGWEVYVLEGVELSHFTESGDEKRRYPPVQSADVVTAESLATLLGEGGVAVFDLTTYQRYQKGHIPSAKWVLRTDLVSQVKALPQHQVIVLTCGSDRLARYAWQELAQQLPHKVVVLKGGNAAWRKAGLSEEAGSGDALSPLIDRYRRPYEGTDNPKEAMQAYLDWEFGLVAQLEKDGTHGFQVI